MHPAAATSDTSTQPTSVGTKFILTENETATPSETIKNIFILRASSGKGTNYYLDKATTQRIAAVGLIIFAVALIVTAIALAAIFCPPVAAVIATAVALSPSVLIGIAAGAGAVSIGGLTFGAAALDKLLHDKDVSHNRRADFLEDSDDAYDEVYAPDDGTDILIVNNTPSPLSNKPTDNNDSTFEDILKLAEKL